MMVIEREPAKHATTDVRRLDLLRRIAVESASPIPSAEPQALNGYQYPVLGDGDEEEDLAYLARRGYLEERFFDRVSLCPKCASHHLNVREICPGCRGAHIVNEGLLHHFRCGYVGIQSEFETGEDGGRICPKCNREMHHIGTEYDRLGKTFVCRDCGVISENPPVEAICRSCGARTAAEELGTVDVFSYILTARGAAAIRRGALADHDDEFFVDGVPAFRPAVIRQFLDYEMKRVRHFDCAFSVLLFEYSREAADGEKDVFTFWLPKLRQCLREIDLLGQLTDAIYVAMLAQTTEREAEALRQRITTELGPQLPFAISVVEISEERHLAQVLARGSTDRKAA
jgi:Thaumarchaeal output domain 1